MHAAYMEQFRRAQTTELICPPPSERNRHSFVQVQAFHGLYTYTGCPNCEATRGYAILLVMLGAKPILQASSYIIGYRMMCSFSFGSTVVFRYTEPIGALENRSEYPEVRHRRGSVTR